jgi:hypothetical protein
MRSKEWEYVRSVGKINHLLHSLVGGHPIEGAFQHIRVKVLVGESQESNTTVVDKVHKYNIIRSAVKLMLSEMVKSTIELIIDF